MTEPKNQNEIITNNDNNTVLNEQETYKLEDFKKWLEEKNGEQKYCLEPHYEGWKKTNKTWLLNIGCAESKGDDNHENLIPLYSAIREWKKEVDEKNQATNSNQITQTTKSNNTDQDLIKKSQEVAKISVELDQVLNKYQPEEIKPLNLTERYEEEKKSGTKKYSLLDNSALAAAAINEVKNELIEEGEANWFTVNFKPRAARANEKLNEWKQAENKEKSVQTALKKIENENLALVKKERSELIGAITSAKRNYEDLIKATSDALELKNEEIETKSKKIDDLTKDNENIIEKGSKELEKAKGEKDAIILNLKSEKEKTEIDLKATISLKEKALTDIEEKKGKLEKEKANALIKLGNLEQTKSNLTEQLDLQTSELDQTKKDKEDLEAEKKDLQSKIQTLTDEKKLLTDEYVRVKTALDKLEAAQEEATRRILNNTLIPDLKTKDLNKLQKQCYELSKTNEAQLGIITSQDISLTERNDRIETIQNSLISMNNEKERLEQQIRELEKDLRDTKIDLNRANVNLEAKEEEINRLEAKIEGLENELAETKQQLSHAGINLNSANRQLADKQQEIDKLKKEVTDREIYIQSLDETKHNLVKENLELFNERNGLNTKINELNGIIETKERQLETNAKGTLTWKTRAETAESKERDLKDKIFSEEEKISNLEVDKSNLEQELNDQKTALSTQITNLQTELNEIKDEINKHFWFNSKTAKDGVRRLIDKNRDLKQYEPSFVHNIGHYTGINWLSNKIGNTFMVVGFGAVASVVAPMIFRAYMTWQTGGLSLAAKRRKNRDNDDYEEEEETPKPRRTKRVKPQPIEAEVEVIKPTLIETETVKQLPEEVMDINTTPAESKPVEVKENLEDKDEQK